MNGSKGQKRITIQKHLGNRHRAAVLPGRKRRCFIPNGGSSMFPLFVPNKFVDLCSMFWRNHVVMGSIARNRKILSKTMCRLLIEELEGIKERERIAEFLEWSKHQLFES